MVSQKRNTRRRLLVLACSMRKSSKPESIPAIERYDGVMFRVLKRLQFLGKFPTDVDVVILSAKYGLISHDTPIPDYDLRMTPELAQRHSPQSRVFLKRRTANGKYREVFICAGKDYLPTLEPFDDWRRSTPVQTNMGKIGIQMKTLKNWLLGVDAEVWR
jgi:hypothetical protein